jgi:hypothetical protein
LTAGFLSAKRQKNTMRYLLRPVAILVLMGCLPACVASFRPTDLSPQEVAAQAYEVKVKVKDGGSIRTVHLYDFWATSDSVGGKVCGTQYGGRAKIWAVPVSAVVSLETMQPDLLGSLAFYTLFTP